MHQGTGVEIDDETATRTFSTWRTSEPSLLAESPRCRCHSTDDIGAFRIGRIRAVSP